MAFGTSGGGGGGAGENGGNGGIGGCWYRRGGRPHCRNPLAERLRDDTDNGGGGGGGGAHGYVGR